MARQGYRKVLRKHGLVLAYNDSKKTSVAVKEYDDEDKKGTALVVRRKKGNAFSLEVIGYGKWRKFLEKDAKALQEELSEYGSVSVVL